jgi:hypothetical protein
MRNKTLTSILVFVSFFFFNSVSGQNQKAEFEMEKKGSVELFNSLRSGLNPDVTIMFSIRALKTSQTELDKLVDLLDKLDNKIVHLECDLTANNLKVGYSNSILLIDLLQVLSKHGYPATFITDSGQKASLNAYGEIEYWNIK